MLRVIERIRYRKLQQQNQLIVLRADLAIGEIKRRALGELLDTSRVSYSRRTARVFDATAIEVRDIGTDMRREMGRPGVGADQESGR